MNNQIIGHQQRLGLFPIIETEVNELQMGVLSDGTPYLTLRGLAKVCGIDHSTIVKLAQNWEIEKTKRRGARIQELLDAQKYTEPFLYISAHNSQGEFYAFTDAVCMAFLEYYAFEATSIDNSTALANYRLLARSSFKIYVYQQCKYNPNHKIDSSWQNFQERLLLNDDIPIAYFSIFKELSAIILNMIRGGCVIDDKTVPDISVGTIWAKYWTSKNLDRKYGARTKHPHEYPQSFRQSAGGLYEAWVYPVESLGEFRKWLYEVYLMEKFPAYLNGKVAKGAIVNNDAIKLLDTLQKPANLESNLESKTKH